MLVTVNEVKDMALQASQITSCKTLVMQAFFSVSNEIGPIFVMCFLGNKSRKTRKITFGSLSKNSCEKKEEKKKTRIEIAKLFALQANAIIFLTIKRE